MTEAKTSNKDYNLPFPTRLRFLLEEKGKGAQSQLADYIGVTRQAISAYSLGNSVPDIYKFQKMAEFFDVPLEFMLGESNNRERENIDIGKATGLSDRSIHLMTEYRNNRIKYTSSEHLVIDRSDILNTILGEIRFYFMLDQMLDAIGMTLVSRSYAQAFYNTAHENMDKAEEKEAEKIYSFVVGHAVQKEKAVKDSAVSIVTQISCDIEKYCSKLASDYVDENLPQCIQGAIEHEIREQEKALTHLRKWLESYADEKEVTENGDDHEKK